MRWQSSMFECLSEGASCGVRLLSGFSPLLRAALAGVLAFVLACALCLGGGGDAWAEDEGSSEGSSDGLVLGGSSKTEGDADALDNLVNPQQLPDSAFINDVAIEDLASADTYYDEQTVQVRGEVVGDAMHADVLGQQYWITLSSEGGLSTAAVCISKNDCEKIDDFGRYGVRGTILQVRGTFHLVCSEHNGESDIHATEVSVVSSSQATPDVIDVSALAQGVCIVVVGLILMLLFYWLRERRR